MEENIENELPYGFEEFKELLGDDDENEDNLLQVSTLPHEPPVNVNVKEITPTYKKIEAIYYYKQVELIGMLLNHVLFGFPMPGIFNSKTNKENTFKKFHL